MDASRTMLIRIGREQDDDLEVSQQATQLRLRLLELDVDSVELVRRGTAPQGSKAGEALEIGALVATFGPTLLAGVLDSLKGWVARDRTRNVEVRIGNRSIKLSNATADDTERLVAKFLEPEDTN
jgi:hypothetical protein